MSERDAMLRAVLLDPDDDTVRLAFADWCDENGEPERGHFIRTQVNRAAGRPARWPLPRIRPRTWFNPWWPGRSCWKVYNPSWDLLVAKIRTASEPGVGDSLRVTRGFVSAITCTQSDFLAHAAAVFAAHPVERVTLSGTVPTRVDAFPETGQWTFFVGDAGVEGGSRYHITNALWHHMSKSWYDTAELALAALSEACVAHGRELAGLPALPLRDAA
jgi:uncharacterized protein (TIGR02996 family)